MSDPKLDPAPTTTASPDPAANPRDPSEDLHHRVQNILTVVLALSRLTARSVGTIDEFQVAFGARVQAMARTNAVLLRGHAQAVSVRAAVELELQPYMADDGQVVLQCAPLSIPADAAFSLSLILHELTANAVRYGALSTPAGRLTVRCEPGAVGGVLTWSETTPGPASHERIGGSGSPLVERLARGLGGAARIELLPHGMEASITFRLANAVP